MIYTYSKNSSSIGRTTMEKKKFKDLTIRDAFLFAAVMTDQEICRKLLELSLGITIASVQVQTENPMKIYLIPMLFLSVILIRSEITFIATILVHTVKRQAKR